MMVQNQSNISARTWPDLLSIAGKDLLGGLSCWRIWYVLATNDIKQRYRRSLLGQLWLTVSMGITIGAIGLVYSVLLNQDPTAYLPSLGVGLVCWALIAGVVNDGCWTFVQSVEYLGQARLPRSLFVLRVLFRNLIVFAHNFIIVVVLMVAFAIPVSWATLLVVPGLMLTMITAMWVGLLLGTLSVRFGDLPPIVGSFVQIAFLITPIIYTPESLNGRLWAVTHLNPFASFIAILREPLLGQVPDMTHYVMAVVFMIGGFVVTFPLFARFRARIVYWL
jgi:ABC-type polysaccharide/polyol phosphate export permease